MKTNTMKTLRLSILLLFIPVTFHAQKTLTGLWTGKLSNDSLTVRQDQSFEIALTQYKEKVYGYSRSTFIVNDTLYYIMKRVKGTIDGDVCEIKDDEIISYNFRGKIDKGIRVTTIFRMNKQDSSWHLAGDWSTNKTKKYYSITGKVELKEETDLEKSKIFPHLEELNLAKEVPFYAEAKKPAGPPQTGVAQVTKKEPPVKTKPKEDVPAEMTAKKPLPKKPETVAVTKPTNEEVKKSEPVAVNSELKRLEVDEPKKAEVVAVNNDHKKTETASVNNEQKKIVPEVSNKPEESKPAEALATQQKKQELTKTEPARLETKKPETPLVISKPQPAIPVAAALVKERKIVAPQEIQFVSDSLQFALYDNGEVDGDTVSVLMNGEIIIPKQGLKTSAVRKTIYIQPGQTEFTIVLYAENLGKYPPNTGLLVVYDGEERYQVRFTADLQQNAAVIFRRKK